MANKKEETDDDANWWGEEESSSVAPTLKVSSFVVWTVWEGETHHR